MAKACVELAYALEISDRIGNLEVLKGHALEGTELDQIVLHEEIRSNEELPFHLIQFCSGQFHFHFFSKYATSVDISWQGESEDILIAYDIKSGEMYHCLPDGENMVISDQTVSLKVV